MSMALGRIAAACLLLVAGHCPAAAQERESSGVDLYGDPLPKGAVARLGTTRFRRRGDWGKGLALTPDGAMLIAASDSHSIYCWDAATGRLIREIDTSPMHVRGFALSRDGKQLAVAGFWYSEDQTRTERQVRILDTTTGQTVQTLQRADSDLDRHEMAFTPDGKLLISLGTAGILRVEEPASGLEILQEKFPRDVNPYFALSPDGSTIAVATGANTRKFFLWRCQSGEQPREIAIPGTDRSYDQLAFSPDGTLLAASLDYGDHAIHLWDVAGGKI